MEWDFFEYPKYHVYRLAEHFGTRLVDFLDKDIYKLLLDSEVLTRHTGYPSVSEETFKLHPSAKALEGFLEKVIKGKGLRVDKNDKIGNVFGDKQIIARKKMRDRRLIAKIKATWDYCRNDIVHYGGKRLSYTDISRIRDDIKQIIFDVYTDLYGKSSPTEKIIEIRREEGEKDLQLMTERLRSTKLSRKK